MYDVSQPTVSRDIDVLAEHVKSVIGNHATLRARAAYERAIDDLFEAGDDEWRATKAAVETAREWAEWAGGGGSGRGADLRIILTLPSRRAVAGWGVFVRCRFRVLRLMYPDTGRVNMDTQQVA